MVLGTGTQALAMVEYLKKAGYNVYLLYENYLNYAAKSKYIDKKIHCDCPVDSDSYLESIIKAVRENSIDVIIPMGDATAQVISKNKERLQNVVKFKTPKYDDFMRGYDKNQLMRLCQENGYSHPQTLDMSHIESLEDERLTNFLFPALLKPNLTTGGRGMVKVETINELKDRYSSLHSEYGDYHLQQFIPPGGRQIKVQLFINDDLTLRAASMINKVRWYPVSGGSNCCAISDFDKSLINMCHHILQDLNWTGFADFDLIENPESKELLVMEINPRVPACIKSPIVAGLNWAQVIVEGSLDMEPSHQEIKKGVVLRHLGLDTLWFLKSPNRWHASPNWFKFFGKNVHYQDMSGWTDPMTFLSGTWRNIKQIITGHDKS